MSTWSGVIGNYRTDSRWLNGTPNTDGTAVIPSGIVAVTNMTVSDVLFRISNAMLALSGAVLAPSVTFNLMLGTTPTISITGPAFNKGQIFLGTPSGPAPTLTIRVADIVSRSGAVVARGRFENSGLIETQPGTVVFRGVTTDTLLVNTGTIRNTGTIYADIALAGSGTIVGGKIELARSVGAGQVVDLVNDGALRLDDPTSFKGTVQNLASGASVQLMDFVAESESLLDGKLVLVGGGRTVTLVLPDVTDLGQLVFTAVDGSTVITSIDAVGPPSLVVPADSFPAALAEPRSLPPVYTDGYLSSGALTAYHQTLHGTILVGGGNGSNVPTVNIAEVVLASDSVIASNAAPARGNVTPYASINATGANRNDGQILANSLKGQFRLTIAHMRSSEGTVLEAGVLQNRGSITATGDRLIVTGTAVNTALVNTGVITATDRATIDLNVTTVGLGQIRVLGGSTLNVGGRIGNEQTISLDSNASASVGATLAIGKIGTFEASIADFGFGDTIKLTGQDFDIAGLTGSTLSLTGASGAASLTVLGATSATDFLVTHTGGSTIITHVA